MTPRDTRTGAVLEQMMQPALKNGGYHDPEDPTKPPGSKNIGQRLGTGRHLLDILAGKDDKQYLISVKWQETGGSAEQKVPFEVICLVEAMETGKYAAAYLVIGGEGWKKAVKEFYLRRGLDKWIRGAEKVQILSLEGFVAKANQSKL